MWLLGQDSLWRRGRGRESNGERVWRYGSHLGAMTSVSISSLEFKPAFLLMWTTASWLASLSPVSHLFSSTLCTNELQSVVPRPAVSVPPKTLLEMQNIGPSLDLLTHELRGFKKLSRWRTLILRILWSTLMTNSVSQSPLAQLKGPSWSRSSSESPPSPHYTLTNGAHYRAMLLTGVPFSPLGFFIFWSHPVNLPWASSFYTSPCLREPVEYLNILV